MLTDLWDKWLASFNRMQVAHDNDTWNADPVGYAVDTVRS